jgi:hypothetical protein
VLSFSGARGGFDFVQSSVGSRRYDLHGFLYVRKLIEAFGFGWYRFLDLDTHFFGLHGFTQGKVPGFAAIIFTLRFVP